MMKKRTKFIVTTDNGEKAELQLVGRYSQALSALIGAGARGVTAAEISSWALRMSHYVWHLRRECGLEIETRMEPNGPPYYGRHARYYLKTPVRLLDEAA